LLLFVSYSLVSPALVIELQGELVVAALALEDDDEYDDYDDEVNLYEDKLPSAVDLAHEALQSACNGQPFVLMFGSSTCPYCSVVRSLYMVPLSADERYKGIVVRELEIDSNTAIRDFSGKPSTMSKLAQQYGVFLVPTVMVFSPDGKRAGKPIIGISNEDFYGFYLDDAIVAGRRLLATNDVPSDAPVAYACD